jgi:DNA polymerase III alpha subunit
MIQLKVRTEYSFGQTFASIDRLIERMKELGCTHAGIVDNASTWGHYDWFHKCLKAGIKPILGIELVVSDTEDSVQKMWFLAKSELGLRELYKASSLAFRQKISTKFGSTPRLYKTDVLLMSDEIYKFAGDIVDGEFLKKCGAYIDISPSSRTLRLIKENLARKFDLEIVYTSDNSYAFECDRKVFEFASSAYTKSTPQHLIDLEDTEAAKSIASSSEDLRMPKATMLRKEGNLEELCRKGIKNRAARLVWDKRYEDRLNYELDLIRQKDFESYFLIVADMVEYAKKHILVGPSRGSAAGSLVCYLSGITEVDPIIHNLYFERFIDTNRGGWKVTKDFMEKLNAIPS